MADRPLKVLIAKPGLDGHDRGAKVLARGLRDEGFEVVYTGLRQTPEMIATAALQEDVDVVGLSILSGAHMTLVPRITKLLRERGMGDVLVTVGGIIPDDDVPALQAAGVAAVFGPGTTIAQVADYLREHAPTRDEVAGDATARATALAEAAVGGDRPPSPASDRRREPHDGRRGRAAPALPARRAGAPRRDHRAARGRQVHARRGADRGDPRGRPVGAVVAVDPSSARSPAARCSATGSGCRHAPDRDVFIRSMASRGHAGGLASTTTAAAAVLDAAGFDLVLLETVGTGQSEVEVAAAADTTVVLEAPEMGDEVQAIKAGLLEVADLVVVNKGDKPGAQRTAAQLRAMLSPSAPGGGADPAATQAPRGPGDDGRDRRRRAGTARRPGSASCLGRDGESGARLARAEAQVRAIVAERLGSGSATPSMARQRGTARGGGRPPLDPYAAADRLLEAGPPWCSRRLPGPTAASRPPATPPRGVRSSWGPGVLHRRWVHTPARRLRLVHAPLACYVGVGVGVVFAFSSVAALAPAPGRGLGIRPLSGRRPNLPWAAGG